MFNFDLALYENSSKPVQLNTFLGSVEFSRSLDGSIAARTNEVERLAPSRLHFIASWRLSKVRVLCFFHFHLCMFHFNFASLFTSFHRLFIFLSIFWNEISFLFLFLSNSIYFCCLLLVSLFSKGQRLRASIVDDDLDSKLRSAEKGLFWFCMHFRQILSLSSQVVILCHSLVCL